MKLILLSVYAPTNTISLLSVDLVVYDSNIGIFVLSNLMCLPCWFYHLFFFHIEILEFMVNINHPNWHLNRVLLVIRTLLNFKFLARNLKVILAAG